jgi:hypothetical protein
MHVYMCMYINKYALMCICTYECMNVCMYVCMHAYKSLLVRSGEKASRYIFLPVKFLVLRSNVEAQNV